MQGQTTFSDIKRAKELRKQNWRQEDVRRSIYMARTSDNDEYFFRKRRIDVKCLTWITHCHYCSEIIIPISRTEMRQSRDIFVRSDELTFSRDLLDRLWSCMTGLTRNSFVFFDRVFHAIYMSDIYCSRGYHHTDTSRPISVSFTSRMSAVMSSILPISFRSNFKSRPIRAP